MISVTLSHRLSVPKEQIMGHPKVRGLHEYVIENLGRRIVLGELAVAKPLPGEEQLCKELQVSRTALREALRVLASKGLVEPKRKVGTLVRPSEHWNCLDPEILSWLLEGEDSEHVISELYELRQLIEPVAASLAAQHAQPEHLQELCKAFEQMQAAGDNGEKIIEPDRRFHQAIIEASGNRLFASLAQVVGAALSVNFELVRDAPRGHRHSMPMHRKVLDAILEREANSARVAMQELIEDSQRDARVSRRRGRRQRNKYSRGAPPQPRMVPGRVRP